MLLILRDYDILFSLFEEGKLSIFQEVIGVFGIGHVSMIVNIHWKCLVSEKLLNGFILV